MNISTSSISLQFLRNRTKLRVKTKTGLENIPENEKRRKCRFKKRKRRRIASPEKDPIRKKAGRRLSVLMGHWNHYHYLSFLKTNKRNVDYMQRKELLLRQKSTNKITSLPSFLILQDEGFFRIPSKRQKNKERDRENSEVVSEQRVGDREWRFVSLSMVRRIKAKREKQREQNRAIQQTRLQGQASEVGSHKHDFFPRSESRS